MPHAGDVGTQRAGADFVKRRRQRSRRGGADTGFECGERALAIGLAERNKPHAGGNPVGRERVQKSVQRRLASNAVASAGNADGDRQRDRSVPNGGEMRERRT